MADRPPRTSRTRKTATISGISDDSKAASDGRLFYHLRQGWVDRITTGTPPSTATVKDPWGNEYRYRSSQNPAGCVNSSTQNEGYDLWNVGRDGKKDAAGGAGSIGKPKNRDDIRNF